MVGHGLRLSLLQNLRAQVQDFFAEALRASLVAKQMFDDPTASSGLSRRNADATKWKTQRI
jgi:hypothetical protein